jgi:hypothetical protein
MDCRVKPGNDEIETRSRGALMRPSFAHHDDAKKDLLPVIKEGCGAPKGACQPCPRLRKQVYANLRHSSAARLRALTRARPPFGAHACGTRHRLSPRWLSPRTEFPEDGLRECFARLALLPSVKHAPCRPGFLPVDRGPEPPGSGWHIRARAPPLALVFQACPSGKAPSMSEVARM